MKKGSRPDVREWIQLPGLPAMLDAYRQPSGEIAIWDRQRNHHVLMPKNYTSESMKAALCNLGRSVR